MYWSLGYEKALQRMFQESFDVSRVFTTIYNRFMLLYVATNYSPIWHIALEFNFICVILWSRCMSMNVILVNTFATSFAIPIVRTAR